MKLKSGKELKQEQQYSFPYHFLPYVEDSKWQIARVLPWGYQYLAYLHVVIDIIGQYQPHNLLDFGCGDGRLVSELYQKGLKNIVGLDLSVRATNMAKSMIEYEKESIRFINSMAELKQENFNTVTAIEVLEHIEPKRLSEILESIFNVMEDGGFFIVSVPTSNIPLNKKHYQHFTLTSFAEQMKPFFCIEKYWFVHKSGWATNLLNKLVVNRFFITQWSFLLRATTFIYKSYFMYAEESNGA